MEPGMPNDGDKETKLMEAAPEDRWYEVPVCDPHEPELWSLEFDDSNSLGLDIWVFGQD
jgi:hypothetical protein